MAEAVWRLKVDLPAKEQAASTARRLLQQVLNSWGRAQLLEDAGIVASELVTNAVQHAADGGELRLDVQVDESGCLNIAVNDGSERLPTLQEPSFDAEAGRGLLIVEQLSTRWGVEPRPGEGKRVWAELG
jgi:anti-sigma regulatory factor (Ser/Thr protein kinase)